MPYGEHDMKDRAFWGAGIDVKRNPPKNRDLV